MPLITRTLEFGERGADVTAIQKNILLLGGVIDESELFKENVEGRWASSTSNALMNVLARFGALEDTLGSPFNASWGRMLHMAAAAERGSSAALFAAVQDCFEARNIAPALSGTEMSWMARFGVIARNFTIAKAMSESLGNPDDAITQIVSQNSMQPANPELLNPENYYTFVYDYVSRADVEAIMKSNLVRGRDPHSEPHP